MIGLRSVSRVLDHAVTEYHQQQQRSANGDHPPFFLTNSSCRNTNTNNYVANGDNVVNGIQGLGDKEVHRDEELQGLVAGRMDDMEINNSHGFMISSNHESVNFINSKSASANAENGGDEGDVDDDIICSMCGDSGIRHLLFLCIKCCQRHQHIYCSRSYPNVGSEASICNWCLHNRDIATASNQSSKHAVRLRITTTNLSTVDAKDIRSISNQAPPHVKKSSHNPNSDRASATTPDNKLSKHLHGGSSSAEEQLSHSKAFEYLLMIAESLPNDQQGMYGKTKPGTTSVIIGESSANVVRDCASNHDMKINGGSDDHKFFGTRSNSIPKRQRCTKAVNTVKWRKRGLHLKANYRRYKLLADVLC